MPLSAEYPVRVSSDPNPSPNPNPNPNANANPNASPDQAIRFLERNGFRSGQG